MDGGDYYFSRGWTKFCKDLELEKFEFLVFWFTEKSNTFDVYVCGADGCEKEPSRCCCCPVEESGLENKRSNRSKIVEKEAPRWTHEKQKLDSKSVKKRKHSTEEENDESESSQSEDNQDENQDETKKHISSKRSAMKYNGRKACANSKSVSKGSPAKAIKSSSKSTNRASSLVSKKGAVEAKLRSKMTTLSTQKQKVDKENGKGTSATARGTSSRKKKSSKSYYRKALQKYQDEFSGGSGRRHSDVVQMQRVAKKKRIAYQKALAFMCANTCQKPLFVSIMQKSHVSCQFSMGSFAKKNVPSKGAYVTFQLMNGKKWLVRCIKEKGCATKAKLSAGWKCFVQDNDLKVGDACIFEVAKSTKRVWNVIIFRNRR